MPELPEVETTRSGLEPHLLGRPLHGARIHNPRLRWPVPDDLDARVRDRRVLAVRRRAKYLLLDFDDQRGLILHLGMSGSLRLVDGDSTRRPHDHVELLLDDGRRLRYHDPRRFGAILAHDGQPETHPLLATLGPEPLSDDFDGAWLATRARGRKIAIKPFIMDSHVVVGIGNIYACEGLFLARIDPSRPAGDCSREEMDTLAQALRAVLRAAVTQGGTTLRDFVREDGQPGYFQQTLQVYGREAEPCRVCGTPIARSVLGQRSSFFCPRCQCAPLKRYHAP
ncbi:MAG: bifunctional DNA-formamidopyrimidine glycosylase/DNA-(apurinic or apyrimidinic site) lyase [Pseudomonadota bacterium]